MLKNATYKEKFVMLKEWIPSILETVKKDLKNDHLRQDIAFAKQYLAGKNINKVSTEDLVEAYSAALHDSENAEALAEFISNRWLLKNGDLYDYFETKLSEINPNFSAIESIDAAKSKVIIDGAVSQFGALRTYLFSVINSVVFPEEAYRSLNKLAKHAEEHAAADAKLLDEKLSVDNMKQHYEQQIARLTDKYEKKLSGLQKKYQVDVDTLKKQISTLTRKLSGQT